MSAKRFNKEMSIRIMIKLFLFSLIIILPAVYKYAPYIISVFVLAAYLIWLSRTERLDQSYFKQIFFSLFAASVLVFFYNVVRYYFPKEWDYTCFYLYGWAGRLYDDFYSPENFRLLLDQVDIPLELTEEFYREVIDVGCPYPPPSIFIFLPLSVFNYENGLLFWTGLNVIIGILSVWLIRENFFNRGGKDGYMLSFILFALWPGVAINFVYSQILFWLLFFLLITFKYRNSLWGGVFLALAVIIKPFALVFILYFILVRNYKSLVAFVFTSGVIVMLTITVYGIQPFIEYITNNPAGRQPAWLFSEINNQSLFAELTRHFGDNLYNVNLIYLGASFLFFTITAVLIWQVFKKGLKRELIWVLLIVFGLIVYPSGQNSYLTVHLITLLVLLCSIEERRLQLIVLFTGYLISNTGLFHTNIMILFLCAIVINADYFKNIELEKLLKSNKVR